MSKDKGISILAWRPLEPGMFLSATDGYKGIHIVTNHSSFDRVCKRSSREVKEARTSLWASLHGDPIRNRNSFR